jgi:hypothetical protein
MPEIGSFDASQHDPSQAFDPMPPGWYAMKMVSSEVRDAKSSGNKYLWCEFEVLEQYHPGLKGRKAWARLNLWNSNAQAVDIAQRDLSAICRAVGQMVVTNSDALHHKPLAVKLKVRQQDGYEPSNEISGFDGLAGRFETGGQQPRTPAPATAHAPGQPPASKTPPWQR